MSKNKPLLLKIFFSLAIVESAIAGHFLTIIPSDVKNAALLGFSASRLALLGVVTAILLASLFLLAWSFSQTGAGRIIKFVDGILFFETKRLYLVAACSLLSALGILFLLIPAPKMGEALVQRLTPVVILGIILAVQMLIFQFMWLGQKINSEQWPQWKSPLFITGIVIAILAVAWIAIAWSGLGVRPEPTGWFAPGTPVLAQQFLFAFAIGLIFLFLSRQFTRFKKLDVVVGFGLWLTTAITWWMEPLRRMSYFTPAPTPPNFEYYPYSDAAIYDEFAQNVLIGSSRHVGLTHRPLYSLFLAALHALAGQKIETILLIQILLLALMPVFIYLLVSNLGGRPAGVLAALVVIFREMNSIALTNIIEVSHVKLLMSDVPTMALMVVFIYFFIKWLQDREGRLYLGALAGACFGIGILIRSQAQLLIPIALFGIIVAKKDGWKPILQKSLVFLLGLLVVVAPWVWRNYQLSGRVVVEYHEAYTSFIASSYTTSLDNIKMLPGETSQQYDARMMTMIVTYIRNNPKEVARFFTAYFIHNEITSVVYLPMSLHFLDVYTYVKQIGFWSAPLGSPVNTMPMFIFSLCLIAFGIGIAWHRFKWTGLMPLLFHLGYSLSVVPVHSSGWRFILPVDWVALLYFSIGLMQACAMLFSLFSEKIESRIVPGEVSASPLTWKGTVLTVAIFAAFGLSLPLGEWLVPVRYPALTQNELTQKYASNGLTLADGSQVNAAALDSFLKTEAGAVVLYGRALYPAYYDKGVYWGESSPNLLEASKYNRVQFTVIGPARYFVFLPMSDAPKYFPQASDVFVAGCMQGDSVRALLVKVNDRVLTSAPWRGLTCSNPE